MTLLFTSCLAFVRKEISVKQFGASRLNKIRFQSTAVERDVRTFASYDIYKGKGALNLKVIPVSFTAMKSSRKVEKQGTLLLEMAPSAGTTNTREYNWNQKIIFGLNPTECGELLAMDKTKGVEFTHDPYAGGPDVGKVMKKLKIVPTTDNKGVFITVSMNDKVANVNAQVSVPVSWGELEVIRSIASYHIPLLLGFGSYAPALQNQDQNNGFNSHSNDRDSIPPVWN